MIVTLTRADGRAVQIPVWHVVELEAAPGGVEGSQLYTSRRTGTAALYVKEAPAEVVARMEAALGRVLSGLDGNRPVRRTGT